ncbi:circularly permuted type 2 ATP-grasp protein [Luteimonas kalidii]|uniref:Circularly permuted type 2 ATP-grasp protein n=1 Tax=Luteimonas kalidii TaxID=3042025 RepID=A0ABT6JQE9_9GAMM|nr:circularly permuted type 2 ATP-grasp protein [Luteimonas kalidii]MDH5832708.1 circularly permuted type 2 ATP-grasp protein [Luteimonas kalidii]
MPAAPSIPGQADGLPSRYRTLWGGVDEMLGADGQLRPVWQRFVHMLDGLTETELASRFARAHQYMRDAGVYYSAYDDRGGPREREWPLSPLPVLIDAAEWRAIGAGLVQRAELLERVVADLHGPQQLVADGLLPPELIAANPEFLRPMVGVPPRGGHYLHFCAFELGRGPDGRWWVLGDRTQAPSGAGFALENRVATVRAFPDLPEDMHLHRLAGFFRRFRDALLDLADGRMGAIGVLTPGPNNETYYEHAWLARYLGVLLLEGDDLTVRDGAMHVRTVSGLQPVSVLWRRVDAAFVDPLELRSDSWIGTAGAVGALRAGTLTMANALGSGVVETRAMQAFLPRISLALTGQALQLPGIATWWCGHAREREMVIAQADRMLIGPAFSTRLPYEDPQATRPGAQLDPDERARMLRELRADGGRWVAQEAVTLSTTPVYLDGRLEPRPFVLRAFVARTPDGWEVMPGGFARIGAQADTRAIAMQLGGQAADVWVVGERPVVQDTLLAGAQLQRRESALPSRAAENLLWLGRYTERSEAIARVLRAYHVRLAEIGDHPAPLLDVLGDYLERIGVEVVDPVPAGLLRSLDGAATSAGRIRDRFSPDGWAALHDLSTTASRFAQRVTAGDDASRAVTVLLRKLAGFSGLMYENMYRSSGWRFLEIGRRIERGIQIADLLALLFRGDAPAGLQQALLEIADSVMTHRNRYGVNAGPHSVLDLLALDGANPRSVMFQVDKLREAFAQLPAAGATHPLPDFARQAMRLHTELATRDAAALDPATLASLSRDIAGLYNGVSRAYFH